MSGESPSVENLVAKILALLPALDGNRRQMFLRWLQAHHVGLCITDANLAYRLTEWLEVLPADGVTWEYRLILSEIAWWRDLAEPSLAELMRSERVPRV